MLEKQRGEEELYFLTCQLKQNSEGVSRAAMMEGIEDIVSPVTIAIDVALQAICGTASTKFQQLTLMHSFLRTCHGESTKNCSN